MKNLPLSTLASLTVVLALALTGCEDTGMNTNSTRRNDQMNDYNNPGGSYNANGSPAQTNMNRIPTSEEYAASAPAAAGYNGGTNNVAPGGANSGMNGMPPSNTPTTPSSNYSSGNSYNNDSGNNGTSAGGGSPNYNGNNNGSTAGINNYNRNEGSMGSTQAGANQ